ncbi:MAG: Mrp/NBP35 family ATP-binding protein [Raineya sp.]|nr:Mrp/NBP35 family ATP-binding protein [Raineya sp.]
MNKEAILQALSQVQEPDLKKDLVTLNMIKNLEVQGNRVSFVVVLTTPACPLKEKIRQDCEEAILSVFPQAEIHIDMQAEVTSVLKVNHLPNIKNIVAIASGKGGVGKSTVTANLAVALAHTGAKVGVIDADIFGPSMPVMFGVEYEKPMVQEINGKQYIIPVEQYGVKLISMGFLSPAESAVVWRGPMASKAFLQFLNDTYWGELDYLLIDLPPGTSDIHLTMAQAMPITGVVIVTTPQKVALADAQKGLVMFRQGTINIPILGIVENMAYFTPAELPQNKYYIFGRDGGKVLAERYNVPFLGEIPLVQGIREAGDIGRPIIAQGEEETPTYQAFKALAERLAQQIAIRNAQQVVQTMAV